MRPPLHLVRALMSLLLIACGRGAPAGGELVDEVFGVVVPQGTYQMAEEESGGNEGAPFAARYLVTPKSLEELDYSFTQAAPISQPRPHHFVFEDGVSVTIAPIDEIPRAHAAPARPVLDHAPAGMQSWITVARHAAPPDG